MCKDSVKLKGKVNWTNLEEHEVKITLRSFKQGRIIREICNRRSYWWSSSQNYVVQVQVKIISEKISENHVGEVQLKIMGKFE